jgi:hypothetical protein
MPAKWVRLVEDVRRLPSVPDSAGIPLHAPLRCQALSCEANPSEWSGRDRRIGQTRGRRTSHPQAEQPTLTGPLELVLRPGGVEATALATQQKCHVNLDDHQARAAATRVGVEVIGTIGILLRAKRMRLIPEVRPLLDSLDNAGFRVDANLRQRALELANET